MPGADAPLSGRVCVVTGGSRGIGRATVEAFVRAGARVALCGRQKVAVKAVADAIGRKHIAYWGVDVSVAADVTRFADLVAEELGPPDILVNNAGVALRAPLEETDEASWNAVIGINLTGTYRVTRAFLPGMRQRGSGRILCVSSIAGRQGTASSVAYCASKHGVVGFVRALAEEVRSDGLVVNAICPGSVATEMLPAEFAPGMPPEEVAQTILWLAAHAPPSLTGACIDQFG